MRGPSFTRQEKKRRLGRGLGSLIASPVEVKVPASPGGGAAGHAPSEHAGPVEPDPQHTSGAAVPSGPREEMFHVKHRSQEDGGDGGTGAASLSSTASVVELPLDGIDPNPNQPRRHFDAASLQALADSIRAAGVMQPILVRPVKDVSRETSVVRYELIAGERRLRAARLIPLETIPAVVREVDDRTSAEWALIENVQREDLNPIERAEAFRQLIDQFHLTHQDLAERVGLDRSSISNLLRLNELDDEVKEWVRQGRLQVGHARSLLGVDDAAVRTTLARAAVRGGMSVRELERRIQEALRKSGASAEIAPPDPRAAAVRQVQLAAKSYIANLEKQLGERLGTRVHLKHGKKKGTGTITIEFYSLDQFDGLMNRMGIDPEGL